MRCRLISQVSSIYQRYEGKRVYENKQNQWQIRFTYARGVAKRAQIVRKLIKRLQAQIITWSVRTTYQRYCEIALACAPSASQTSSRSTPPRRVWSLPTRPIDLRNRTEDRSFLHKNLMRCCFSTGFIWSNGLLQMNFVVCTLIRSCFKAYGRRGVGLTEDKLVEVRVILQQQRLVVEDYSESYSFISLRLDTELSAFSVRSGSLLSVTFAVGKSFI